MASFAVTWIILALFWIALSGPEELIGWATHDGHVGLGELVPLFWAVVSVTGIAALSHRHLTFDGSLPRWPGRMLRLPRYLVYLMWEILKANWDVILRVIGVRPVRPRIFRFSPRTPSDFAHVTLANSITLTPGTVTVEVEADGSFIIHAISPEAVEGVLCREMEAEVIRMDGGGGAQ